MTSGDGGFGRGLLHSRTHPTDTADTDWLGRNNPKMDWFFVRLEKRGKVADRVHMNDVFDVMGLRIESMNGMENGRRLWERHE